LSDTGANQLTPKQQKVMEVLENHPNPTVRSAADILQKRAHRSERFSDDEVRGLLERLEEKGLVVQEAGEKGEQRYRLA
jgi:Fe2+ or Zn2+ uptake regulation protein